jgi:tripeptidyl-peptidase-1
MLTISILLSAAIAAHTASGSPILARTAYSIKEIHNVPRKWTAIDRAPAHHMLHMQIGLKQSNFDELERHLYEGMDSCSQSSIFV